MKTFAEGTVETMKREQVCSEDNWKEWALLSVSGSRLQIDLGMKNNIVLESVCGNMGF